MRTFIPRGLRRARVPVESMLSIRRRERGVLDLEQFRAELAAVFDEADE
jgi:hypothetical protein